MRRLGPHLPRLPRVRSWRARPTEHDLKTQEQPLRLTTSLGLGVFDSTRDASADAFFSRVDDALYQAKHQGRNRLCLA